MSIRPLTRTQIGDGVFLNTVQDGKFKHNRLSVNFVLPLDRATASDNAVVPHILRMRCAPLPDFSALAARLQELYGAVLDADIMKFGGYQVMEVTIRGLDNRYAMDGEDITAQCARLLADIVLRPHLENGLFAEKDVALQRQYVQDAIDAEINDKRSYALSQCVQTMCAGEPVAVRRYGYADTAAAITARSATDAYNTMLRRAPIEIMFVGAGDPDSAAQVFTEAFRAIEREHVPCPPIEPAAPSGKVKEKTETMELSQAKLVMGMRCTGIDDDRMLRAARMFSAMFGGTPFSKLFLNVREKLSLCYYCASRFDVSTKLLLVDSGVEAENRQKAQDEILRQLEAVAAGDFTDEELANTKLLVNNSIMTTTDSLHAIEGWYLSQILRGKQLSPQEDAAAMQQVTREDVVAAAKAVSLDTIYFLTGKEDEQ